MPGVVLIEGHFKPILIRILNIIDSDKYIPCISAASIIAKVTRDRDYSRQK